MRGAAHLDLDPGVVTLAVIVAVVAGLFALQGWHLPAAAAPYTDEGVYAEAGRLILGGSVPHRDFLLVHVPLVPVLTALVAKVTGSMLAARYLYLAVNCASVLLLFRVLLRESGSRVAALAACLAYATFHEMVFQDFRFIALRQVANVLFLCLMLNHRRRVLPDALLCVAGAFTFLPFLLSAAAWFAASVWRGDGADERRRAATSAILSLAIAAVALAIYFLLLPGSFEQIALFQARRPFEPLGDRLRTIGRYSPRDVWLYGAGALGLACTVALDRQRRPPAVALAVIAAAALLAGRSFYPHYLVTAGPALAWGICCGAVALTARARHRDVVLAAVSGTVAVVQLAISLPSLFHEWKANVRPEYHAVVEALRSVPGPVLAFEPIFAVEAGAREVFHFHAADARTRFVLGQKFTEGELAGLEARACSILLERFTAARVVPDHVAASWRRRYPAAVSNGWGTVLVTGHSGCGERATARTNR